MDYVPRIDELITAPPFLLGSDPPTYKFEASIFLMLASDAALTSLVTKQLNAPFAGGPIRYRVPSGQNAFLAFFRYERAESANQADDGWLAYTEAMIGFAAVRETLDASEPDELVTYLGVVYIDDSQYTGQVADPNSIPICIGREAYGLPKSPGQIKYDPDDQYGDPGDARLEVWDVDPASKRLTLAEAIRVSPGPPIWPLRLNRRRLGRWIRSLRRRPRPPRPDPFAMLAAQLGAESVAALALRRPSVLLQEHGIERQGSVDVLIPSTRRYAVAYENRLWRSDLVGLKQFPDPQDQPTASGYFGKACYQALIESPLEEIPGKPITLKQTALPQTVLFPVLNRVDLLAAFGIQNSARSVLVPASNVFYESGVVRFADPTKVKVWKIGP
jgi:hypothetical protein